VGIDDIINRAKHLFGGKIDDVAGSIKDETPDAVDPVVDKIADKAKDIF